MKIGSGIWSLFAWTPASHFFDNAFSLEQLEENHFRVLLLLYFEAPANQFESIKDKELTEIILSDDVEHLMHVSQTQPQNGDQKVLRVISMKEQLCKPQGKCTWNTSISFCVVTLYLHKYNREKAGHCTEKFFYLRMMSRAQLWTQPEKAEWSKNDHSPTAYKPQHQLLSLVSDAIEGKWWLLPAASKTSFRAL